MLIPRSLGKRAEKRYSLDFLFLIMFSADFWKVVEIFFLASESVEYVELEFSPCGAHLILLLHPTRLSMEIIKKERKKENKRRKKNIKRTRKARLNVPRKSAR